jgi:hypothetical protein
MFMPVKLWQIRTTFDEFPGVKTASRGTLFDGQ